MRNYEIRARRDRDKHGGGLIEFTRKGHIYRSYIFSIHRPPTDYSNLFAWKVFKPDKIYEIYEIYIFFYLDFLSRTFVNHRTAGERGGHFFNSSLPNPLTSQTLRH